MVESALVALYTRISRFTGAYEPAVDAEVDFTGKYAADFLVLPRPEKIPVWHLVGGLDPLDESELKGDEPQDGYPVHL